MQSELETRFSTMNVKADSEHEFESRLLKTKEERQRVEDNVLSLRNRIQFLKNEEDKLLTKIEATIDKAGFVAKVKNDAKDHSGLLSWASTTKQTLLSQKKVEVKEMRQGLEHGLHTAYHNRDTDHRNEADNVRDQLERLNEDYAERRRAAFANLVHKCTTQKESEKEFIKLKHQA